MSERRHIALARKARGLSQHDLAREVGIAQNTVSRIERGERVQLAKLRKVVDYLEVVDGMDEDGPAYPADVELMRDVVAEWLMRVEPEDRAVAVLDLFDHLNGSRVEA